MNSLLWSKPPEREKKRKNDQIEVSCQKGILMRCLQKKTTFKVIHKVLVSHFVGRENGNFAIYEGFFVWVWIKMVKN